MASSFDGVEALSVFFNGPLMKPRTLGFLPFGHAHDGLQRRASANMALTDAFPIIGPKNLTTVATAA